MSYVVKMSASEIDVKIPINRIRWLFDTFYHVDITSDKVRSVELEYIWEEDSEPITGTIIGNNIVIDKEQCGRFKNSGDGGLSLILREFNGNGIIEETGEDGDFGIFKFRNGKQLKGKVVFEDD